MRNLIKRLLIKLGLRKPIQPANLILRIENWEDGSKEEVFSDIGWKFTSSHGIIGTGTVKVERSEEHEQTNTLGLRKKPDPTFIELMEPLAWRFYGERKDQEVNCILFNVTDE